MTGKGKEMESYVLANARIVSPADGLDMEGSVRVADGSTDCP